MISNFQTASLAPTVEDVYQFLVRKCLFQFKGKECEKKYLIGKDTRDCLLVVLQYTPEQGLYSKWELFGQSGKSLFIESTGRPTKALSDFNKWSDNLSKASKLVNDDIRNVEKFIRG